ncbi:hypothetical protein [Reichenbachiella ulvae]|uniref:DUF4178 domain-containing protein n=1 Tax=Reichenbachiella ulvae TaxID=2980104 RepID=A0ABT3CQV9_9BACT|nr:hypothetical protein [Reichenbachiella ulvae]MCV9386095.1 hypothetical protein [Reichenbachiella ulvae]
MPDSERLGTHYFPIQVGQFHIYEVEETNYYLIGPETENYQLRVEAVDSVMLSSGEVQYTIHRSRRLDENSEWKLDSIWNTSVSLNKVVANENNVSFVKLVFPIDEGSEWDANVFNSRSAEYYRYADQRSDTTLADQSYTQTIRVIHSDEGFDSVGRDDRFEVYAPHAGLIYKEMHVWAYFQEDGQVDPNKIVSGRDLKQVLISYGQRD